MGWRCKLSLVCPVSSMLVTMLYCLVHQRVTPTIWLGIYLNIINKKKKNKKETLHVPAMKIFQLYDLTVEKICNEVSVRKNIPTLQKYMSAWIYKRRGKSGGGGEIKAFTKNLANALGMHFSNGPSLCPCYILSAIIIFFMIGILLCLQIWNFYYPLPWVWDVSSWCMF